MKLFEKLRRFSFWSFDFFKGSPINKHYTDIKYLLENYNTDISKNKRNDHLNKLLNHAIETTPFYGNISPNSCLQDFPIIDKGVVQNNYEDFKSKLFINDKNTPVVTSGSTGTPFKVFHNKNKRNRHTADVIYFGERSGFNLGNKLYYIKVWNKINMKSNIKQWMENLKTYSVFNYTDDDIKMLIATLKKDKSKKAITCFASTCDVIVNYLDSIKAKPEDFNIVSIMTNSDALSNVTKDKMQEYFNSPVMSRYSNMENGILGMQPYEGGYEYELNWASFHIEVLDMEEDKLAKYGEMGRVVVTDLFNYCMPLIRYNTGDIAKMSPNLKNINGAPVLEKIEGRKVDLIKNTKGEVITSHIVTVNMWKYTELKQYQFAQKGEGQYLFRLNPRVPFEREHELISEFKGYLGEDATINIEYVNEVPQLASGKRKLVVNEI